MRNRFSSLPEMSREKESDYIHFIHQIITRMKLNNITIYAKLPQLNS